jgi:hypothetical protein
MVDDSFMQYKDVYQQCAGLIVIGGWRLLDAEDWAAGPLPARSLSGFVDEHGDRRTE